MLCLFLISGGIPLSKQDFIDWVERKGKMLRRIVALSPTDVLDPFKLANTMGIEIFTPCDIVGFSEKSIDLLEGPEGDAWSAGAMWTPVGIAVVMNPSHALTRQRATLMEELAHIHLNHKMSQLTINENGVAMRSYIKKYETEAYWVGAAALLPREVMLLGKNNRMSSRMVARQYVVSDKLVKFRENVTRVHLR